MAKWRCAAFGAGWWAQYQIGGWQALVDVDIVAIYNRSLENAQILADRLGIPAVYDDPTELLDNEQLDFVDIITNVETHRKFVELAASYSLPIICQKPMAPTYEEAEHMVKVCQEANVPLIIHENWRWQETIRQVQRVLQEGTIGRPFRARIQFSNSFPVFAKQPFLAELEQFILTDMGSHILDVARFLFGEADSLYAHTQRVNPAIRGEDVATVLMKMNGVSVSCELSYASKIEHDRFPETYIFVEGSQGSVTLDPDFWVRVTTKEGTRSCRFPPVQEGWMDPLNVLTNSAIKPANAHYLQCLRDRSEAETSGTSNLRTMALVFAAYESAARNQVQVFQK